ncbi:MAG: Glycosyltransferase involved in cell wall bisynthesis [Verrucomicrobia bacterium]|nr:MAG: Glycosyltransferase involved in cell wall bisynthesis [Verrucomicrobiota bacterium]
MNSPAITVIIATHNRATLLRRALASLLAQQLPCHEIIVVSDVSDSGTYAVANELLRKGDVFAQRPGIPGPAASRNLALKLVTGTDVVFLDDDDAFKPDFLANVAAARAQGLPQEILFTSFEVIHEHSGGELIPVNLAPFALEQVWIKNFIPNNCLVYPAPVVKDLFYDESIAYEDWDFVLSAHARAPLRHVPINGPLIYKNANAEQAARGEENNAHLLECYIRTYQKHPATAAVREQRKAFFAGVGIDIEACMQRDRA